MIITNYEGVMRLAEFHVTEQISVRGVKLGSGEVRCGAAKQFLCLQCRLLAENRFEGSMNKCSDI